MKTFHSFLIYRSNTSKQVLCATVMLYIIWNWVWNSIHHSTWTCYNICPRADLNDWKDWVWLQDMTLRQARRFQKCLGKGIQILFHMATGDTWTRNLALCGHANCVACSVPNEKFSGTNLWSLTEVLSCAFYMSVNNKKRAWTQELCSYLRWKWCLTGGWNWWVSLHSASEVKSGRLPSVLNGEASSVSFS